MRALWIDHDIAMRYRRPTRTRRCSIGSCRSGSAACKRAKSRPRELTAGHRQLRRRTHGETFFPTNGVTSVTGCVLRSGNRARGGLSSAELGSRAGTVNSFCSSYLGNRMEEKQRDGEPDIGQSPLGRSFHVGRAGRCSDFWLQTYASPSPSYGWLQRFRSQLQQRHCRRFSRRSLRLREIQIKELRAR
jgi:hypothetical protein